MSRSAGIGWQIGVSILLLLGSSTRAFALHTESLDATRVTRGAAHNHSAGRHWSTRGVAFSSEVDLLENGSTGRQLYVFDLLAFDCNRFSTNPDTPCPVPRRPAMLQVTHGPGSPDNPSLVFTETVQFMAFDADGSFDGGTGPAASHRQVFLMNLITGEIVRVTNSADGDSTHPSLSASGTVLYFESTAPLAGKTDLAGTPQIFAYKRQFKLGISQLIQITAGHAPSTGPMPNRGGNQVAFQSDANLLGDGSPLAASQIFFADVDWNTTTFVLTQITNGNAPSRRPYLSAKQDFLIFESEATDFPTTVPGDGVQIYSAGTELGNFPPIGQLTDTADFGSCTFPALNEFGDGAVMICTGDPLQNGTEGNRAFWIELSGGLPTGFRRQITGRGDVRGPLANYMGRDLVTLVDNTDLTGAGICDYQLFIVDIFVDPRKGLEFWHTAAQPGDISQDLFPPPPPPPPPDTNALGSHTFAVNGGDPAHASHLGITTTDGTSVVEIIRQGQIRLQLGARDLSGESSLKVATFNDSTVIPPTSVGGVGVVCVRPTSDGIGAIDCDGGRADGDILIQQYHGPDPANPGCVGGCFETRNGTTCRGPHLNVCRGPVTALRGGAFLPGGVQFTLPVKVSISSFQGFDGIPCTADDDYTITDIPIDAEFTTGNLTGTIIHADAEVNDIITLSATGEPFDCDHVVLDDLHGARLVTVLPLLDLPHVNGNLKDVLLSYSLEATIDNTRGPCNPIICTSPEECDDGDPSNGQEDCVNHTCVPGTPPCDDGNACNGIETEDPITGDCIPGTPPQCGDGNLCTVDTCSPSAGCIHTSVCDDGNGCNGEETCDTQTGACGTGAPLNCDDGNPCTDDSCSPLTGCVNAETSRCDDGDACNGFETCNPSDGSCVIGTAPNCNDDNLCTIDSCDHDAGCVHASKCDDGNACDGFETCDPETGGCGNGATPNCDDGNLCTIDTCNPAVGCQHGRLCDDGDACNGLETCDPQTGTCGSGSPPNCDDHNLCTVDGCNSLLGCVHVSGCDDGNACTDDSCNAAAGCIHTTNGARCNDGNNCTNDACDPIIGCTHTNSTAPCDDGDLCTSDDACHDGVCSGELHACDDGELCNGLETCDPHTGGCQLTVPPISDFFSCKMAELNDLLQQIRAKIVAGPPEALGKSSSQRLLLLAVDGAIVKARKASTSTTITSVKFNLGSCRRRVRYLVKKVQSGLANGKIFVEIGNDLVDLGTKAVLTIEDVQVTL